jgi:ribosomal protein S18 acetylase RimI-like enzyme
MLPDTHADLHRSAIVAEVVVRTCRAEDLPALEWFGQFTHHRQVFTEAFARHLRGENLMLVADLNGFPVGQAWIDLTKRRADSVGYVWAVRVFSILRNLGLGTALMATAENLLQERGFAIAEVGVEKDNAAARRLYERLGYRVVRGLVEEYQYTPPGGAPTVQQVEQWLMHKQLGRTSMDIWT